MANSYFVVTAEEEVKCSKKEHKALIDLINEQEDEGDVSCGLSFEYDDKTKGMYIFSDESANPDDLSKEALEMIGKMIKKSGKKYLELGYANYCDRPRMGSAGGGAFRIYPNGEMVFSKMVFER